LRFIIIICLKIFQDQDTALHWASRGSYGEIVSLLYAAGADVNIQNKVNNLLCKKNFIPQ
jgi:ankyrin repeat protein